MLEQLAERIIWGTAFVPVIFLMTQSQPERLSKVIFVGFLLQSPFQTVICTFLHVAPLVLGLYEQLTLNRTLKHELQRGCQGEERKSRPFSLDNSSGEVGYCAKPYLESRMLFQLLI